jgi:hypothetical protein
MYPNLVGRPELKRPLGRPCRRWENNLELGCEEVKWIHLARDKNRSRSLYTWYRNEYLVSTKVGEFIDQLSKY